MAKFAPKPSGRREKSLLLVLDPELHQRIKDAAARSGVTMRELVQQALVFALDHMD